MRFGKTACALDFEWHDDDSRKMEDILTISERKQARVSAIRKALPTLERELQIFARRRHGRYMIFGSTVTERLHYGSDIDILADFPLDTVGAAVDFANMLGERFNVPVDVVSYPHCKPQFLERVLGHARVLA